MISKKHSSYICWVCVSQKRLETNIQNKLHVAHLHMLFGLMVTSLKAEQFFESFLKLFEEMRVLL